MDLTPDELREIADESYALYRRTKHWRAIRRRAIERAGQCCEQCTRPGRLDVHHLTYERLGEELPEDLRALCRECHAATHGDYTATGGWLRDSDGNIVGRVVEVVVEFFGGETSKEGGAFPLTKNDKKTTTGLGVSEGEGDGTVMIWELYVHHMKPRRTEIDPGARAVIRDALKVATVEECCGAIAGCAASPFHMGRNDRRKKYNKLSQILKGKRGGKTTREQIDMFLEIAPQRANLGGGLSNTASSLDAKIREAKRNVLTAYDLAGSVEARARGDESESWLAQQGIRVVRQEGARPVFEVGSQP